MLSPVDLLSEHPSLTRKARVILILYYTRTHFVAAHETFAARTRYDCTLFCYLLACADWIAGEAQSRRNSSFSECRHSANAVSIADLPIELFASIRQQIYVVNRIKNLKPCYDCRCFVRRALGQPDSCACQGEMDAEEFGSDDMWCSGYTDPAGHVYCCSEYSDGTELGLFSDVHSKDDPVSATRGYHLRREAGC